MMNTIKIGNFRYNLDSICEVVYNPKHKSSRFNSATEKFEESDISDSVFMHFANDSKRGIYESEYPEEYKKLKSFFDTGKFC